MLKERNIAGIIFDLDGVICSTDEYHYLAWKFMADELGARFDRTINERLRGVSRMECLEIVLETYQGTLSPEEKQRYADKKNAAYQKHLLNMSPASLSEDVRHTLDTLRERGYRMAIGSSSKNTPLILKQIGLDRFFDAVADGNSITKSKPDPEVFLQAAEGLGLKPEQCLVIEDAEAGIEAAQKGGMMSAAIGYAAGLGLGDIQLQKLSDLLDCMRICAKL
ncbi:beta-phosphoglucomutase [Spirochaetia bacterium]|nr:beta-phosphoglucomutase [Spirochaetia bacterium]